MLASAIGRLALARVRACLFVAGLAACSILAAACSTTHAVMLPQTPHAFVISCSGANLSWSHCYRKAGQACPHGYSVVQKPYKHDERIAAGDALQLLGDSGNHRRMLIACRPASAPPTGGDIGSALLHPAAPAPLAPPAQQAV